MTTDIPTLQQAACQFDRRDAEVETVERVKREYHEVIEDAVGYIRENYDYDDDDMIADAVETVIRATLVRYNGTFEADFESYFCARFRWKLLQTLAGLTGWAESPEIDPDFDLMPPPEYDPYTRFGKEQKHMELFAGLTGELDKEHQQLVEMMFFDRLPEHAVLSIVDIPPHRLKEKLRDAVQELVDILIEERGEQTPEP